MKISFWVFLTAVGFQSLASAKYLDFEASYQLSGRCNDFSVSQGPGSVAFSEEAPVDFAYVGRGPTNDGANGCRLFKSLMECPSSQGAFSVTTNQGPIFNWKPVVLRFQCQSQK